MTYRECHDGNLTWVRRVVQANVLKFGRVHPLGNGVHGEREADFGSEKVRSEFVAHRLDPWQPFGKQSDPLRIVPTVKDEARARGLHGSGVDPDLIFAIPILSPYNEGEALADDIHQRGLIIWGACRLPICPARCLLDDSR